MTCAEIRESVDAYLDGEGSDQHRRDFETHVETCSPCQLQTQEEKHLHAGLRAKLKDLPDDVPEALRWRIEQALAKERQAMTSAVRRRRALAFAMGGTAMAAAATILWIQAQSVERTDPALVEAVLRSHQRNLPMEVASDNPENVRGWFRGKVDIPVRPLRPYKKAARLVGGRVSHVRDQDAAQLVYDVSGHKVSVLIFDPRGLRLDARPPRKPVQKRDVRFEGRSGYNIALFQHRGLGYAVTAEGSDSEVQDFVNAAFTEP